MTFNSIIRLDNFLLKSPVEKLIWQPPALLRSVVMGTEMGRWLSN